MAGIISNDRKQGARVRRKLLNEVERILDTGTPEEKKEILMKMCANLLPRLNEHTGEDGEAIQIKVINYGDPNSVSVPTETVSTTVIGSTSEIQDSGDSSPRGEVEDSTERTDSENPA